MAFGALKGSALGGNGNSIGTSNALTGSVAVAVGDLIVVVFGQQTNLTCTGATDNLGNSYSAQNAGTDPGSPTARMFYSRATVAGTLTQIDVAASSSTNDWAGVAAVIEGPVLAPPIDANPANITSDATSPFTCPATGTLAIGNEIVIGWGAANQSTVWAATSPNLLAGNRNNSTNVKVALGYQAVTATSSVSPAFTAAANPTTCILGTASFKGEIVATDGAITAQSATAAGSGLSSSASTDGAISAQSATAAGTGASSSSGAGVLSAQAADVTGTGTVEDSVVTGTGALAAQAGDVTGVGISASLATDGDLSAQSAAASGAGLSASLATDGAIAAQSGTAAGAGVSASLATDGSLEAQSAAASGAGLSVSLATDGAITAQAGDVTGAGISASLSTDGAVAAQAAAVDGSGLSESLATDGAIASQSASASGAGTVGTEAITGTGALMAQAADAAGEALSGSAGAGMLAAGVALAAGEGQVGEVQLPAPDHGWRQLTGEYPKPRRREPAAPPPPRLPPLQIPAPAQPSARVVRSPGLRIVADADSPIRDLIIGEMTLPELDEERRARAEEEQIALALLLAA